MSASKMVFEGECRNCPHTIRLALEATQELVNGENYVRARCKQCSKTNAVEQTEIA